MEFGFEPVCDQLRAGASYLDMSTCRDSSNLLEAGRRPVRSKFHYAILVADKFEAGSKLVADRFEPASNLSATSFEPASNQLGLAFTENSTVNIVLRVSIAHPCRRQFCPSVRPSVTRRYLLKRHSRSSVNQRCKYCRNSSFPTLNHLMGCTMRAPKYRWIRKIGDQRQSLMIAQLQQQAAALTHSLTRAYVYKLCELSQMCFCHTDILLCTDLCARSHSAYVTAQAYCVAC